MNADTKWSFQADYLQACNCDYGCPCEFSAPPTTGHCDGLGAWRINRGNCGDISLAGLGLAFCAHWPAAIHLGGGTVCILVDERANQQQRDALLKIASGQLGGLPFEILATTFSTVLDPVFAPFRFNLSGRESSFSVGSYLTAAMEPIKNPVTGDPESVRVEHGTGFIFQGAEAVSAKEMNVAVDGLRFSYPNKAGFVTQISYGN
jgi:hypothetical protein